VRVTESSNAVTTSKAVRMLVAWWMVIVIVQTGQHRPGKDGFQRWLRWICMLWTSMDWL